MLPERERLYALCVESMQKLGLTDKTYHDRLDTEIREIDAQAEHEYLLGLYDKQAKFKNNEHNLFVAYLLGLVDEFDIYREPAFLQGEFPDIDIDYLPEVRDYLKNVWAPKQFGEENVCSIGTYGTLGIKMALKDMTRVHGVPRDEIEVICKKIPDKDDDGKELQWDKALVLCPELNDYCARYPDISEAVRVLLDRRKSGGVHAGGLIISNRPIADFVPLEVRSVKKENKYGVIASAWGEGLHSQDLGAVGLVKFDLLVVEGLHQIAVACQLIKDRYGIESICAKPGQRNWSDTSYLNDREALEIAGRGDTKCIFQFGSEGIRKMVKNGGVTSFTDIAAYSALYRPGPMGLGMHDRYCERKQGREKYTLHPVLRPILGSTYGVMVFQEQVLKILNIVGGIPEMHCEKLRKAISKKKIEQFSKSKEMFIKNGQKVLGADEEYVRGLWDQVEAFADYGFNKSHSYAYSFISARQLWLMAHYPLEFYTAMLMCENDSAKIKEIKIDAFFHDIEVAPIHINKSRDTFTIQRDDDGKEKIFYGFSNLQTIGSKPAARIMEGQPYASFEDFLHRFGTDGAVIKALVALDAFREGNRLKLYMFAEHWKEWHNKRDAAQKRFGETLIRYDEELKTLLESYRSVVEQSSTPEDLDKMGSFTEEAYELWEKHFADIEEEEPYNYKGEIRTRTITALKRFQNIRRKREQSISGRASKDQEAAKDGPPSLSDFEPHRCRIKLEPKVEELLVGDTGKAESIYYGYKWVHELEECELYDGLTIDRFLFEGKTSGCIEVKLLSIEKRPTKKGDSHYYVLKVEDANGKEAMVTMWSDDHDRFQDDLKPNNLLKMRVTPPEGGWSRWSFETVKRHMRRNLPRNKDDDHRLCVMQRKIKPVEPAPARSDAAILLEE